MLLRTFIGRKTELDAFYQCFFYRHMRNGVYYCGGGGLGKTAILNYIHESNVSDHVRYVTPIIDFFETRHQSKRGLQEAIRMRIEEVAPNMFSAYDAAIAHIEQESSEAAAAYPGLLATLDHQADQIFIECCQRASIGSEIIFLFDTFERVQNTDVGAWFQGEFLSNVRSLIIAITGRPVDDAPPMPDNVHTYLLPGLRIDELQQFINEHYPDKVYTPEVTERIHAYTDGNPLLSDLIISLASDEGFWQPYLLQPSLADIRATPFQERRKALSSDLRGTFKQIGSGGDASEEGKVTDFNLIFWAMAHLKYRFDIKILSYLFERSQDQDYDLGWNYPSAAVIQERISKFSFVKAFNDQEIHLLHDEVQQIIEPSVEDFYRDTIDELIVVNANGDTYHDWAIAQAEEEVRYATTLHQRSMARTKAQQLRVEQFSYLLGYGLRHNDPQPALDVYQKYRADIDSSHDYAFEEELWAKMREHLLKLPNKGKDIATRRALWLRENNLYNKVELHYRFMIQQYAPAAVELRKYLGFALMRQGKLDEAISVLETGRNELLKDQPGSDIADYENLLGQVYVNKGQWDLGLTYYVRAAEAYLYANDPTGLAGSYSNRSYVYALQALTEDALTECGRARALIESLPDTRKNQRRERRLSMFIDINFGTAFRHSANFDIAQHYLLQAYTAAHQYGDQELICNAAQHLGINACLRGRMLRRIGSDLSAAIEQQRIAWNYLLEATTIAERANWLRAVGGTFSRMARVVEEVERLSAIVYDQQGVDADALAGLTALRAEIQKFHTVVEDRFVTDLMQPIRLAELAGLDLAARFFELSSLAADATDDFHRALDSLIELARLLLEQQHYDLVSLVMRQIERLKGYDYQEGLFAALNSLIEADLDFAQGRHEAALVRYAHGFADYAEQKSYPSYRLTDRLRRFDIRIRQLPLADRLHWCRILQQIWLDRSVSTVRPDMLRLLEDIRHTALLSSPD